MTTVYDRLAHRIRQTVRHVHENELSGVERCKVVSLSPFRVAQVEGELVLEDGEPDFSIGETLHARLVLGQVSLGDLVWLARSDGEWHALDVNSGGLAPPAGGGGGGGGSAFSFTQATPAAVWTITHGFGRYPAGISIYDATGRLRPFADVTNSSINTTVVTFNSPLAGSAELI